MASQFDLIGEDGLEGQDVDGGDFVEVYFADSKEPLRLDVEQDAMTVEEFDEAKINDDDLCQIANLFTWFEILDDGSDHSARLRTSDSSIIWLPLKDIAFFSVPLHLLAKPGGEAASILLGKEDPA